MSDRGWRKRSGTVFTRGAGEFSGWFSLNISARPMPIVVDPRMGVLHEPTEDVFNELLGRERTPHDPPTVLVNPGWFVTGRQETLRVGDRIELQPAVRRLVEIVDQRVEPFLRTHMTVSDLLQMVESGRSIGVADYKRPVLLALAEDPGRAQSDIESGLAQRSSRTDPEAEQFRSFASNLLAWIADRC